jgi:hypothetical protein
MVVAIVNLGIYNCDFDVDRLPAGRPEKGATYGYPRAVVGHLTPPNRREYLASIWDPFALVCTGGIHAKSDTTYGLR